MELEKVLSDLLALRQLYGHLQNIGYGLQNKSSENLDENARLLLKNLLDNATGRLFDTHSKIKAAQSGVSNTPFPSEPPKAVSKLNPPISPATLKAFPSITQNSSIDSKCQTDTSQKDERPPKKPTFEEAVSKLYKPNKLEYSQKRCRVCGRSRMKPQKTTIPNKDGSPQDDERHNQLSSFDGDNGQAKGSPDVEVKDVESVLRSNENPIRQPKRAHQLQRSNPSMVRSSTYLVTGEIEAGVGYDVASQTGKKAEEVSDFSEDVTNAVKRIESRISALQQVCSQIVDSTKTCAALGGILPRWETPLMQSKEGLIIRSELSYGGEGVVLGRQASGLGRKHNTSLSPAQQLLRQNVKPIESPSRSDNATNQIGDYVHGFRVPTTLGRDDLSKKPPAMSPTTRKAADRSRLCMPTQPVGSTASSVGPGGHTHKPSSRTQIREKELPHQMVIKPTLLDHKSSKITKVYRDTRTGTHKMTHESPQRKEKILPRQWDEELDSSSYFSSSSSLPNQIGAHHCIGLTSASVTHGSRSEESGLSLEESDSSFPFSSIRGHYRDTRRVGPTRRYSSYRRRRNPEKAIGRFTNKLGLIFHHHHHHHHHDDDDRGHSQVNHHQSLWKPLQKIFHRSNLHEVHDRAVQKVKRSTVANAPHKHQVGHFHALVEGLLRHVRHSKRSKPSRGGIRRMGDGPHVGSKKVAKKLHWWQMYRRHGGVKLPKRRRVRVGFMRKKPLLKMT